MGADWGPKGDDPNDWDRRPSSFPAADVPVAEASTAAILESAAALRTMYLAYVDVGFNPDQALTIVCALLARRQP